VRPALDPSTFDLRLLTFDLTPAYLCSRYSLLCNESGKAYESAVWGVAKEAIVIVDMLNGFLEPGNPLYCGDGARAIIPNVVSLLSSKPDAARIFVCDSHTKSDPEFGIFPPHCIEGTEEARVVPELEAFPGRIVRKRTFDGFFGTDLADVLGGLAPDKVYAVGVCTDICVLYTVAGLRLRGYEVIVPRNCVASFDKDSHKWALRHFVDVLGAEVA